jgi:hypothetical protein
METVPEVGVKKEFGEWGGQLQQGGWGGEILIIFLIESNVVYVKYWHKY